MNGNMGLRMNISNFTTRYTGIRNPTTFWRWYNGYLNLFDPQILIDSHQVRFFLMTDNFPRE